MTRLYINKQEITPLPPDLTSLEQVVKLVESDHLSPDTVIRDIQIDGQALIADNRTSEWPQRIDNREVIEIFTSSLQEVAIDSIQEAVIYLERIENATPSLAKSFRSQFGNQEFENLKHFYEGFYWTNLLLDRLERSFEISMETVFILGSSARQHHLRFAALLKEMIRAHEKREFGLVADLLEYEIAPLLPVWKMIFSAIQDKVITR
jgi:hypothetical protein